MTMVLSETPIVADNRESNTSPTQIPDIKVFVDFDGTISTRDIGDRLFEQYGSIEPFNTMFKNNEMDIYEYWTKVCATLPDTFSQETVHNFAQDIEIDAYFKKFLAFLDGYNIKPTIISDGFIQYIAPTLKKEGIEGISVFSNSLIFTTVNGKTKVTPEFRYAKDGCQCMSAVCKRAIQCLHTTSQSITIYIGDGYSDFCPAESSDIIFAKKNLAKWCNANSVPHYPYKSFYDVIKVLTQKFENGKFKQRNRARVLRDKMYRYE